jgi:molybdate/tungstate transport system ATP-binding protein
MIQIDELTVTAGTFRAEGLTFRVPTGAYAVLMGRTGSGKTTLLETICGLKRAKVGCVRLGGRNVTLLKAAERGIGYVPQDGALFQTMSVRKHLQFALTIRKWSKRNMAARVEELAALLGLSALLERKPHGLSGGEAQRVALGRALAFRPKYLCLDEPLSALDETARRDIGLLLKQVQQLTGVTVLHVTHSRWEAELLADQMLELVDGRIRES